MSNLINFRPFLIKFDQIRILNLNFTIVQESFNEDRNLRK